MQRALAHPGDSQYVQQMNSLRPTQRNAALRSIGFVLLATLTLVLAITPTAPVTPPITTIESQNGILVAGLNEPNGIVVTASPVNLRTATLILTPVAGASTTNAMPRTN